MVSKKKILLIVFLVFIICISLILIYASNTLELIKNNQKYEKDLKEKNRELTLVEQIQKLEVFKEKCIEIRANPNDYYKEFVDACK